MTKDEIKLLIDDKIYENTDNEITATILKEVLYGMVDYSDKTKFDVISINKIKGDCYFIDKIKLEKFTIYNQINDTYDYTINLVADESMSIQSGVDLDIKTVDTLNIKSEDLIMLNADRIFLTARQISINGIINNIITFANKVNIGKLSIYDKTTNETYLSTNNNLKIDAGDELYIFASNDIRITSDNIYITGSDSINIIGNTKLNGNLSFNHAAIEDINEEGDYTFRINTEQILEITSEDDMFIHSENHIILNCKEQCQIISNDSIALNNLIIYEEDNTIEFRTKNDKIIKFTDFNNLKIGEYISINQNVINVHETLNNSPFTIFNNGYILRNTYKYTLLSAPYNNSSEFVGIKLYNNDFDTHPGEMQIQSVNGIDIKTTNGNINVNAPDIIDLVSDGTVRLKSTDGYIDLVIGNTTLSIDEEKLQKLIALLV